MLKRYATAASLVAALLIPLAAEASGGNDSIWINAPAGGASTTMSYGDMFTAGYSSRASQPWGFAQCWANETTVLGTPNQGTYAPGDVIWSEYRSLYAGGPVPAPFDLIDPIQHLWLGGGATCKLSLVKFSGGYKNMTVLATTSFTVSA
jgi:hypothetical protein